MGSPHTSLKPSPPTTLVWRNQQAATVDFCIIVWQHLQSHQVCVTINLHYLSKNEDGSDFFCIHRTANAITHFKVTVGSKRPLRIVSHWSGRTEWSMTCQRWVDYIVRQIKTFNHHCTKFSNCYYKRLKFFSPVILWFPSH